MAMNYGGKPMTREEYEYRKMKEMYDRGPADDYGYGMKKLAVEQVAAAPEKPKHMNPKLLLLKGV